MAQKKISDEEIDLVKYLEPARTALKIAGLFIKKIRRNILLFILIAGVGIISAFLIRSRTPIYYVSEGIFLSRALPDSYCTEMIENLNKTISENPALASKMFNLEQQTIKNIHSIKATPGNHEPLLSSIVSPHALVKVSLIASDNIIIDSVENKIIPFLLSSQFARNQQVRRQNKLRYLMINGRKSLENEDSLKYSVPGQLPASDSGNRWVTQTPALKQTLFLQQYLSAINEEMNAPDLELFIPFIRTTNPDFSEANKQFIKLVMASIIFSMVVILFLPPKRNA